MLCLMKHWQHELRCEDVPIPFATYFLTLECWSWCQPKPWATTFQLLSSLRQSKHHTHDPVLTLIFYDALTAYSTIQPGHSKHYGEILREAIEIATVLIYKKSALCGSRERKKAVSNP